MKHTTSKPESKCWQAALAVLLATGLFTGCTEAPPARFRLNMVEMTNNEITEDQQQTVANVLGAMFGTPDEPFVFPESGLDLAKLRIAAGPVSSDERGNETGLYRRHCAHCHGISGDGAGPTAAFLNPYPRDYRQGVFKFKSTERTAKPTREDLRRILTHGVPGTAMPSFRLLKPAEIDALIEYVMYLSMRGETEQQLVAAIFDLGSDESLDTSRKFLAGEILTGVAEKWSEADDQVIRPAADLVPPADEERDPAELAASISAGKALFHGEKGACIKCHGPTALGDGETTDYDEWNKAVVKFIESTNPPEAPARDNFESGEDYDKALARYETDLAFYHQRVDALETALPPRNIIPRNLRLGVFRGGRRPLDIYRRIHAGINGVPMPANAKASPEATVGLAPEEIWNLVDYVRSLPFEPLSQPSAELIGPQRERL